MKKIRFLYNNLWDASATTLTSLSAATGFPASNTQHRWHTRAWRSTGLASEWLKVNLGGAQNIKALVIKYHNIGLAGTTLKIQADADDASWGAPTVDTTLTVTADQVVYFWSANQNFQWWRILATDAANPDTYIRIGRVFLGTYFEPTYDIGEAYVKRLVDPSDLRYTTGGQLSAYPKTQYAELEYGFPRVTSSDKATFETMFAAVGTFKPYFVCHDADIGTTATYYVQNTGDFEFGHLYGEAEYTLRMSVQGLR